MISDETAREHTRLRDEKRCIKCGKRINTGLSLCDDCKHY